MMSHLKSLQTLIRENYMISINNTLHEHNEIALCNKYDWLPKDKLHFGGFGITENTT